MEKRSLTILLCRIPGSLFASYGKVCYKSSMGWGETYRPPCIDDPRLPSTSQWCDGTSICSRCSSKRESCILLKYHFAYFSRIGMAVGCHYISVYRSWGSLSREVLAPVDYVYLFSRYSCVILCHLPANPPFSILTFVIVMCEIVIAGKLLKTFSFCTWYLIGFRWHH